MLLRPLNDGPEVLRQPFDIEPPNLAEGVEFELNETCAHRNLHTLEITDLK